MQTEISFPTFDFDSEFQRLKTKRSELDVETIQRLLMVQKTKSMMMRKNKLSSDIEKVVEWAVKEDEKMKINFLTRCAENGFTEQDLVNKIPKA